MRIGVLLRRKEMPMAVGSVKGFLWQETSFHHVLRVNQATGMWGANNLIFTFAKVLPSFVSLKDNHKHSNTTKGWSHKGGK